MITYPNTYFRLSILINWISISGSITCFIVKVTVRLTVGQSVNKPWCRAPSGAHGQILITLWQFDLVLWGALSDERTGLFFVYAAGPCQRILSWVRVPWDSRPYFTVSDLRLPFSSPPTTRRVTVEVFHFLFWVDSLLFSSLQLTKI
jgi:hypothetical protein